MDGNRPDLDFTESEINKAYNKRLLRIHPDKQLQYEIAIPQATCRVLLSDVKYSKNMLIEHCRIKGESHQEKKGSDWVHLFESRFDKKINEDELVFVLNNFMSETLVLAIYFATFDEGKLFFRHFDSLLFSIQRIDRSLLYNFLIFLKNQSTPDEFFDEEGCKRYLKRIVQDIISEEQMELLILATKKGRFEIGELFTDKFIDKIMNMVEFLTEYSANLPNWKLILAVYLISIHLTANSLPKWYNALEVLFNVIKIHKGMMLAIGSILLMATYALFIIPKIIFLRLLFQLLYTAFQIANTLFFNGRDFINVSIELFSSKNYENLQQKLFLLGEILVNSSIRLSLTLLIELIDAVIFLIIDKYRLTYVSKNINEALDVFLAYFKPQLVTLDPEHTEDQNNYLKLVPMIELKNDSESKAREKMKSPKNAHFFSSSSNLGEKIFNDDDPWLENILIRVITFRKDSDACTMGI